jgi:hypothetical protein
MKASFVIGRDDKGKLFVIAKNAKGEIRAVEISGDGEEASECLDAAVNGKVKGAEITRVASYKNPNPIREKNTVLAA